MNSDDEAQSVPVIGKAEADKPDGDGDFAVARIYLPDPESRRGRLD